MLRTTLPRLHRFAAARFSPEGEFGLHLTIGLALMLAAGWVFGEIAEDVVRGAPITVLDVALAHWFHAHARAGLTQLMLVVTYCHSVPGMLALTLLLGWWLRRRGESYWLLALVATVPGGMVLNVLLKLFYRRARPHFDDPLLTLPTYSFPSGHTVAAALFYGLAACYLVGQARRWPARIAVPFAAWLLVALVAVSRMYLGVHYLSDVLAAAAEGCAWLAVCITGISTLRRRRAARAAGGKA
ncbi:MAG: phosphatase PAP2 family protein [Massilia sp.]